MGTVRKLYVWSLLGIHAKESMSMETLPLDRMDFLEAKVEGFNFLKEYFRFIAIPRNPTIGFGWPNFEKRGIREQLHHHNQPDRKAPWVAWSWRERPGNEDCMIWMVFRSLHIHP